MSIFEDGLSVFMAVVILVAVATFSYTLGGHSVRKDCDSLNAFYANDKVYVCKRVK